MHFNTRWLAILILVASTSLMSCKVVRFSHYNATREPYVKLTDGKKYTGTNFERTEALLKKDVITLDDTTFKIKDVAFYSDGKSNFAKVGGKRLFATQQAGDKINIYNYTTVSSYDHTLDRQGFQKGRTRQTTYYVQQGAFGPLKTFGYTNLKSMVNPKAPEFKLLEQYKKTKHTNRIISYASLGVLIGGIVLATGDNQTMSSVGAGMAGVSFLSLFPIFVIKQRNHARLVEVVNMANKVDTKNAKHKRVE